MAVMWLHDYDVFFVPPAYYEKDSPFGIILPDKAFHTNFHESARLLTKSTVYNRVQSNGESGCEARVNITRGSCHTHGANSSSVSGGAGLASHQRSRSNNERRLHPHREERYGYIWKIAFHFPDGIPARCVTPGKVNKGRCWSSRTRQRRAWPPHHAKLRVPVTGRI